MPTPPSPVGVDHQSSAIAGQAQPRAPEALGGAAEEGDQAFEAGADREHPLGRLILRRHRRPGVAHHGAAEERDVPLRGHLALDVQDQALRDALTRVEWLGEPDLRAVLRLAGDPQVQAAVLAVDPLCDPRDRDPEHHLHPHAASAPLLLHRTGVFRT